MSGRLQPKAFEPATNQSTDLRVAEALEWIAARMSMIEYDTTIMRMEITKMNHTLGTLASARSLRGSGAP